MPQLIKDRALAEDRYVLVREAATLADVPSSPAIVPLALWRTERGALLARGDVGVLLGPTDDPAAVAEDAAELPVIAIDFPKFTDGRGYSIARLLRERHAYTGELRAVGDVLRDQLFALSQCGFDAFALRADRDAGDALASFADFASVYTATTRTPQPWFRRRATAPDGDATARRVEDIVALLRDVAARHSPAVFASSFGAEDMVIIDLIAKHALPIRVFTLDTGRLPDETHALIDRVRTRYGLPIDVYTPDARLLQRFVRDHGANAFYRSVDLRKACCGVRKTEPLTRALVAKGAWITGLRRAQSVTRAEIAVEEYDEAHALPKYNPLADWSDDEVWSYLRANDVPYNALHDRGYPSIGCAPCTRAVEPGQDVRAGRWWWEHAVHKECGLHRRSIPIVANDTIPPVAAVTP